MSLSSSTWVTIAQLKFPAVVYGVLRAIAHPIRAIGDRERSRDEGRAAVLIAEAEVLRALRPVAPADDVVQAPPRLRLVDDQEAA